VEKVRGKSINKLFALLLILSFVISFVTVAITFAAPTKIFVDPASGTANVGSYYHVDIKVEGVTDLSMWEFSIGYDINVLGLEEANVAEGGFLKGAGSTVFNVKVFTAFGYAKVACALEGPVGASGSGVLASLDFLVLGNPPGVTDLDLYDTTLYDVDLALIDHDVGDGEFHVDLVAMFYFTPQFPIANQTVWFNGSASFSPTGAKIVDYLWDFGDGSGGHHTSGALISWYYKDYRENPYMVNLTVTDEFGRTASQVKPLLIWRDIRAVEIWVTDYNWDYTFSYPAWYPVYPDDPHPGLPPFYDVLPTIGNYGTQTETFNATLKFFYPDGSPCPCDLVPYWTNPITLGANKPKTLYATWYPTDPDGNYLPAGIYKFTLTLSPVPGERADLGNLANNKVDYLIEIKPVQQGIIIDDDKNVYYMPNGMVSGLPGGSDVKFNATAINRGTTTLDGTLRYGWYMKGIGYNLTAADLTFKVSVGSGWSPTFSPAAAEPSMAALGWQLAFHQPPDAAIPGSGPITLAPNATQNCYVYMLANKDLGPMKIHVMIWNDTNSNYKYEPLLNETILSDYPIEIDLEVWLTVQIAGTGKFWDPIQAAITAATAGDTILVYPGTYYEALYIKKDLTLKGVSITPVVKGKMSAATNYGAKDATIFVEDAEVDMENLDIQGSGLSGKCYAVIYETSNGTIKGCTVSPNTIGNINAGVAIGAWDNSSLKVEGCTIENFGRIGVFYYDGCSGGVYDSTIIGQVYSGIGDVNYGIEVEPGAYADSFACAIEIFGNEIYNCSNTYLPAPTWSSAGIVIDGWRAYYDTPSSVVKMRCNDIHDNYIGIEVVANSLSWANENNIYNNTAYGVASDADYFSNYVIFDARYNWWGHASGPTHSSNPLGTGDEVTDYVDFTPWLSIQKPPIKVAPVISVVESVTEKVAPAASTCFTKEIVIERVEDLYAFQFTLKWNRTDLFELVPEEIHVKLDPQEWYIKYTYGANYFTMVATLIGDVPGKTGDITVVNLVFHIIYDPCYDHIETALFTFENVKLSDSNVDPIYAGMLNGKYVISAVKPKLEIRPGCICKKQTCVTFDVEVWVIDGLKMHDYWIEVKYNTTLLDAANVVHNTNATWFPGPWADRFWYIYDATGTVQCWLTNEATAPLATGSGLLFTITFHVAKGITWKANDVNITLYGDFKFGTTSYLSIKCPTPAIQRISDGLLGVSEGKYWYTPVPGDVDRDGEAGLKDLYLVFTNLNTANAVYDITGDVKVDVFDLAYVAKNFGRKDPYFHPC
jgi:PKD repeat protein